MDMELTAAEHRTGRTVERAEELATIASTLRAAAAGDGTTLVLEGTAGAGKTHLLEDAEATARRAGMRTLRAEASPLASGASFGLVLDLLDPLLRSRSVAGGIPASVARILEPGLLAESDDDAAALACLGLARLCERVAGDGPLALLVDDLQWSDPASLDALATIARRASRAGIALVAAVRLGEETTNPAALAALRGEPPARIARVGPLTAHGVGELLDLRDVAVADERAVSECARVTGGNPLLVTQVATVLAGDSQAVTAEAVGRLTGDGAVNVAATVEARLRRLGPEAERLTAVCAVLGDDATTRHAAELAEMDEGATVAALDKLAALGILQPEEPLRFTHPLVRDAIYSGQPAGARARDHGLAASMLAAEGADPERVASHLLRTRPAAARETVNRLRVAAEQALGRGVPSAAARYLERAVAEPPTADGRAEVLLGLGFAEALLGRPGAAERLGEARAAASTARVRAEADLRLGRLLYAGGSYADAERAFERGRAELGASQAPGGGGDDRLDTELRACSLAAARYAGTFAGRQDERLEAVLDAPAPGSTPAERALLAELALELGVRGEPRDRVVGLAMRAWAEGALATGGSDRHGIAVSQVAAALVWSDAYPEAEAVLGGAVAESEASGARTGLATARYMRAWLRLYRGDLAGALDDASAALGTEGWDMYLPAAHSVVAHVHIERSDLDAAERALELPGGDEPWRDSIPFALMLEARGRLAALRGDERGALADLLACGELVAPMGAHQPYSRWRARAALCLVRAGEHVRARELAGAELDAARGAGAPRVLGTALVAHGIVAGGDEGLADVREGVAALASSGAAIEHARALCRLGEQLRRRDRPLDAREPLREAVALADDLGAALVAERAVAELTASGGRPRRRALRGGDSLTPAERRVARLAATGRTNRQIAAELVVTDKTVQFHLTNAYRKLDIASREELAAALAPGS